MMGGGDLNGSNDDDSNGFEIPDLSSVRRTSDAFQLHFTESEEPSVENNAVESVDENQELHAGNVSADLESE